MTDPAKSSPSAKSSPENPWSAPVTVSQIPETGLHSRFEASPAQRVALAAAASLRDVSSAQASFELSHVVGGRVHAGGAGAKRTAVRRQHRARGTPGRAPQARPGAAEGRVVRSGVLPAITRRGAEGRLGRIRAIALCFAGTPRRKGPKLGAGCLRAGRNAARGTGPQRHGA